MTRAKRRTYLCLLCFNWTKVFPLFKKLNDKCTIDSNLSRYLYIRFNWTMEMSFISHLFCQNVDELYLMNIKQSTDFLGTHLSILAYASTSLFNNIHIILFVLYTLNQFQWECTAQNDKVLLLMSSLNCWCFSLFVVWILTCSLMLIQMSR